MTFEYPYAFGLLALLVPAVLLLASSSQASRRCLRSLVPARLERSLVRNTSTVARWVRSSFLLAAFALAVAAVASPMWGRESRPVQRTGRDVVLLLDVSKSMYAPDISPNRLTRAKLAAQDLIARLDGDRIGLVAFAGRAFLQAPLTIDYDSVLRTLLELRPDFIPRGGTNIAEAIEITIEAFGKAEGNHRAVIILSDGEELTGDAIKAARAAASKNILINTIGVGTPDGALIVLPREHGYNGDFVRDERGEVVKSRLDESRLKEIARVGGGVYVRLGDVNALDPILNTLGMLEKNKIEETTKEVGIHRYQWPLAAALFLVLLSMAWPESSRRRVTSAIAATVPAAMLRLLLVSLLTLTSARSALAETDPSADPQKLYRDGKFDAAYQAFIEKSKRASLKEIEFNAGCAAFKAGNFEAASKAFSNSLTSEDKTLQQKAHYNLGNTFYRLGEAIQGKGAMDDKLANWRSALQHYDSALNLNSNDQAARLNREFVRKKIEELEQQQQQQQQQQQDQQQQQKQQQQQQEKEEQNQQNQAAQQQAQPQQSQQQNQRQQSQQDAQAANASQEQQQQGASSKEQQKQQQGQQGNEDLAHASPQNTTPNGQETNPSGKQESQAVPQPERDKPLTGELKAADKDKQSQTPIAEQAQINDAETANGEMSPAEAVRLIEQIAREEDRVLLDEQRFREPVYKDW